MCDRQEKEEDKNKAEAVRQQNQDEGDVHVHVHPPQQDMLQQHDEHLQGSCLQDHGNVDGLQHNANVDGVQDGPATTPTTLATLTQEERRLLEDIQLHLPNHIRNLPEQEKMQFLEMHILALRKHLKHEQYLESLATYKPKYPDLYSMTGWKFDKRFLAVVEKAKQALKLVSKADVSSSSVSPGSVSVASMSPAASSAVQSEVVLSSEAKSSIGITREEVNKMSSAMNYLLIEGKSATKEVGWLVQSSPGVFSLPVLDTKFAQKLLSEVRHFEQWCTKNNIEIQRPNSMNNYGAILDHFGFDSVLNEIMTQLLQPLSRILFPHLQPLDGGHHGFIVSYETDKDVKLDFHRDDSELTLNVCVGTDFEGGELYFGGVRCRQHQQLPPTNEEGWNIPHKVGHGLIHLGAHRHSATPIKSGKRENLILWCRSESHRKRSTDLSCGRWCGAYKSHLHQEDDISKECKRY